MEQLVSPGYTLKVNPTNLKKVMAEKPNRNKIMAGTVDAIYFDFAKAFDRAHDVLIEKLKQIDLNENLIKWIRNFLKNRRFRVKVGSSFSVERYAQCGVPQGSVLSPLLFGIYVNSISEILPPGVKCKQFADDLKIYAEVTGTSSNLLQEAIASIVEWADKAKLSLNQKKTVTITLGTKQHDTSYNIDGDVIRKESVEACNRSNIHKMLLNKVDLETKNFFTLRECTRTRTKTRFVWEKSKTKLRSHFLTNRTLPTMKL
ncbi:hypothetical protein CRE_26942 [Caenorhabditis remanei]|uniref:Reverse transcriptase domain-containing protein n=1 Tax=Caenorhabditis remanei TaxID=31234 RepID=E3LPE5_CAERE|nr:hypothetical protein CRE_26942 [Caenorhabditis remanei]